MGNSTHALAERFLRHAAGPDRAAPQLLKETVEELSRRQWPGNVRELRNAIEYGALMARGGAIALDHLPPPASLGQNRAVDPASALFGSVHQ